MDGSLLFIVQKKTEAGYRACTEAIRSLAVPDGHEIDIVWWRKPPGVPIGTVFNQLMQQNKAKYRIFLPEETRIVQKDFLSRMLKIFQADDSIGMLGVSGARHMALSGRWQEAKEHIGDCYEMESSGALVRKHFGDVTDTYESVQCIAPVLFATQYDIQWQAAVQSDMYSIAQSQEFLQAGYQVVVPQQEEPWCVSLTEQGSEDDNDRQIFLQLYAPYQAKSLYSRMDGLFHVFGRGATLGPGCTILGAGGIAVGGDVHIGTQNWLRAAEGRKTPSIILEPHARIGAGCTLRADNRIQVGRYAEIGNNVHMADRHSPGEGIDGISFRYDQPEAGQISIGYGCKIEDNVVIQGDVHIGNGSCVLANSVLRQDVPAHCIAAGNPARAVELFDREEGKWLPVADAAALQEMLARRDKERPILTVGIPTYKRSRYLRKCLAAIYAQVGDDDFFEVMVSDNHSMDDTEQTAMKYKDHRNLYYRCHKKNTGGANFNSIWRDASGEYVLVLGDDDYLNDGVLYYVLHTIYRDRNASIIAMDFFDHQRGNEQLQGINAYIGRVSYYTTYISGIIMKKDLIDIEKSEKILADNGLQYCHLHQVAMQLDIMRKNDCFSCISGAFFRADSGEAVQVTPESFDESAKLTGITDLGRVFIQEYFDIFAAYSDMGITEETIKKEKEHLLIAFLLPWCKASVTKTVGWQAGKVLPIYCRYYKDEPYFEEGKKALEQILANVDTTIKEPGIDKGFAGTGEKHEA